MQSNNKIGEMKFITKSLITSIASVMEKQAITNESTPHTKDLQNTSKY